MSKVLTAIFFACALVFAAAPGATAQPGQTARGAYAAASLDGDWRGVYFQGIQPTEFGATFDVRNGQLVGTMIEPNNFGNATSFWLLANVAGQVSGDQVRFVKTYDGTGGQSHDVIYEGRVLPGGRRIVGTWRIDQLVGRFEMAR